MKIRMRTLAAGPECQLLEGHTYTVGVDLSAELAQSLLDGGYAESAPETTTVEPEETAVAAPEDQPKVEKPKAKKKAAKKKAGRK